MQNKFLMMHVLDVNNRDRLFKNLFKINEKILKDIEDDMRENGFNKAFPLIIWGGNDGKLIDGFTRLQAAKNAGILDVPVVMIYFENEEEALACAIKCQTNRRNLTDGELLTCLQELDKRKKRGENLKKDYHDAPHEATGRGSEKTAELLGISRAKVERARAVGDHGSDEIKDAVTDGSMSINKAYNTIMQERRQNKEINLELLKYDQTSKLMRFPADMLIDKIMSTRKEFPMLAYNEEEIKAFEQFWIEEIKKASIYLPKEEKEE